MLLKKQTVWLLTMLSLVVVLSVYYVTSDPERGMDLAAIEKDKASEASGEKDAKVVTEAAGDEAFETMRLTIQDKRSKEREELTTQAGSPELTVEEKDQLYVQMQELTEIETKEKTLESRIIGLGYEDALVRAVGNDVLITVKNDEEHTKAEAVEILQLAKEEIGTHMIPTVEFQSN